MISRSISVILAIAVLVSVVGTSVHPHVAEAQIKRPTNNTPIQINGGSTSAYPSTITAPAMPGVLADVDVFLTGLNYPEVGRLQVLLVSPAGTSVLLMAFAGGAKRNVTGASLRFNQSAPGYIPEDGFHSGQFRPSVYKDNSLRTPAPPGPYAQNLGSFRGESPAGTWKLYVAAVSAAVGRIDSWRLDLVTDTTEQTGDIIIGSSNAPSPADVYPSTLTVSGADPDGTKVISVRIDDLSHDNPDELDILLQGPEGQTVVLMSDAGGTSAISGMDLTFSDRATQILPFGERFAGGTYRPTNHFSGDTFPAPAPVGPYGTKLSVFSGANPNGDWKLFIVDDSSEGGGSIATGWSLNVDTSHEKFEFFNLVPFETMSFGGSTAPSAASIYPATIRFSDTVGPITRIIVRLGNLSHFRPDDIDIRLTSPSGDRSQFLSDAGGSAPISNDSIFIDTAALISAPDNGPFVDLDRYLPTNYNVRGDIDSFPAPIPGGTYSSTMNGMLGTSANGDWRLWVVDDRAGENGALDSWGMTVETRETFTLTGAIRIINSLPASPYPSNVVVTGANGVVDHVEVTLDNVNHTFPDDLDIMLVGPRGQSVVLMSDAGGGGDLVDVDLTFSDDAAGALSDAGQLTGGVFRPTNMLGLASDVFRVPAPVEPSGDSLAVFNGTDADGTWRLFVVDDRSGSETGTIGGWSLRIETNEPVTLTDVPDTRVAANAIVHVTTLVNDPEGEAPSFVQLATPSFTTQLQVTSSEHTWRFQPTLDDIGTHEVALRVTDGQFSDEVRFSVTVFEDTEPPTVAVTQSPLPNANGWNNTNVTLDALGSDPEPSSGIEWATGESRDSGNLSFEWNLISPDHLQLLSQGEGVTEISVNTRDGVNQVSAKDTRIVRIDKTAPVSQRPRGRLIQGGQASQTTVPVEIEMKATDALSGVESYQLRQSLDGGSFVIVPVSDPTQARVTTDLEPGHTLTSRSRATDLAGNTGTLSSSYAMHLTRLNDTEPVMNLSYSDGWTVQALANAIGGDEHVASAAGETMSVAWFGTSIAWLAGMGPNRGIAEVFQDGVLVGTIDLYSPTTRFRMMAFTFNGNPSANADHILEIRVTGTKNIASTGTRIDVDAFVTIRRE